MPEEIDTRDYERLAYRAGWWRGFFFGLFILGTVHLTLYLLLLRP